MNLNVQRKPSEDMACELESSDVGAILQATEVGLALFDQDLQLVHANDAYIELCGYEEGEAVSGASLRGLARLSLERTGVDEAVLDEAIERNIGRLKVSGGYTFCFIAPSGFDISVQRKVLDDGRMLETVRENSDSAVGSDHDRIELVAQTARKRMSHALDSMADGFALFDENDRLVIYNRQYVDLNPQIADIIAPGMPFEEMLRIGMERSGYEIGGLSKEHFIQWRIEQHRDPGDAYDLMLSDGRWVRVHEQRTADGGIVGTRTDVTELKKHEAELISISNELRRKNMLFDTALNNMIQGLCMFDQSQTLIVCNRRYLELYGFDPEVVKPGIKLQEIMEYSISIGNYTKEDAERALAERPDHAKRRTRATLKQFMRDGRVIAVMHQPMPDGGSIATYQDITEIERHERNLTEYTRRLEASNRELQDFAYVASHDLQEPLRKIETFGDRLAKKHADDLPEGAQLYIERMQNATSRMRMLINDLLGYSRVTSKAKPFQAIDLNDHIDGVVSDLQIRIEETGASIEYDGLPTIEADPVQMRQLLQNLIGNALKFQKPDTVPVVKITHKVLQGDATKHEPDFYELRVADNGIGFDNKYKEQIFAIFQRLHGRNEFEGTGIGLATVRKIAERHGGSIDADGQEGEGATFIVRLPVSQAAKQETLEN